MWKLRLRIKYYLTLILFSIISISFAQQEISKPERKTVSKLFSTGKRLDTNLMVYDLNNKPLKYYQYTKLTNSGEYTIRFTGHPDSLTTKRYLKKISPEEQFKTYEDLKDIVAIKSPYLKEGAQIDLAPFSGFYNTEELKNKVVLLIFWSADCPPCTEAFEPINEILNQLNNPKDLMVIAITPDKEEKALAKLKEKPLKYSDLISNGWAIMQGYQLNRFPGYVISDKLGTIRFSVTSAAGFTLPMLKNTLRACLNQ